MVKRGAVLLGALLLVVIGTWVAGVGAASGSHVAVPLVLGRPPAEMARTLTVGNLVGQAEHRAPGAGAWAPVTIGQTLPQGTVMHTVGESRARLDLTEGSFVALGFSTTVTVTQVSPTTLNPVTVFTMGDGWVVFHTPSARGSGSFEVRTTNGTVYAGAVSPSAGSESGARPSAPIAADSAGVKHDTAAGHTEVPVYGGIGTVFGRHTDVLQSGSGQRIVVGSLLYDTPYIGGPLTLEDLAEANALLCLGATGYVDWTACDWTATPTATPSRTPTPTYTPMGPGPTAGPTNTPSPTPYTRPTHTWPTPDPSEPPSAEELANQGTHTYIYTAVGHGSCNPDPTGQETVTFTFSAMSVTLSAPSSSDTIVYQKISHNVYRVISGTVTAYIEFRADGWLYWADVNGFACVDYVYVRAD